MRRPEEDCAPPSIETARTELDAWWRKYETAVKAGDVATLGPMHADSACLVEPGVPTLRGRTAVVAFLGEALVLRAVGALDSAVPRPPAT